MTARGSEIFISYAHADNPSRYESRDWEHGRGWVECFHRMLLERLRQVRGVHTEIWRDGDAGKLAGSSVLTDTLRDALSHAKVLIAIASPSYAASQWCRAELEFFRDHHVNHDGLRYGNRLRVLKVNKLPVSRTSFLDDHADIANSTGYAFHRIVDGLPLEFDPPSGSSPGDDFCRRLNALAHDLAAILEPQPAIAPSGRTIFLAHTSPEVTSLVERLRSELLQHGHAVLPETGGTSLTIDDITTALTKADISIHVVGTSFDKRAEREYDLARRASDGTRLVTLSWRPLGALPDDARQRAFVERFALDPNFAGSAVTLEEFKTIVRDQLRRDEPPATGDADPRSTERARTLKRVYLVFDQPDREHIRAVDDWLFRQGFEIVKPTPDTDPAAFRKAHNGRLKSSDGVLIFHGHADETWLEAKLDELWKVYSLSRQRSPKARGVVLADPVTSYKREFRAHIAHVIPGFGEFDPETLAEFADDVRRDAARA